MRVWAIAFMVLLSAAACGGSDDDADASDEDTATSVPSSTAETDYGDATLSPAELNAQQPTEEVAIQGDVYVLGREILDDDPHWEYDVSVCDSVKVAEGERGQEISCEGESVALTEDAIDLDLEWQVADISGQYVGDVVLRGVLRDGVFEVTDVVDAGGEIAVEEPPLPIEENAGEDLASLRSYLRDVDNVVIYLAESDFPSRVEQLRANCTTIERLQEILDNLSSRGPEAPQDYVAQHWYVCPDFVEALTLPEGVTAPAQ